MNVRTDETVFGSEDAPAYCVTVKYGMRAETIVVLRATSRKEASDEVMSRFAEVAVFVDEDWFLEVSDWSGEVVVLAGPMTKSRVEDDLSQTVGKLNLGQWQVRAFREAG